MGRMKPKLWAHVIIHRGSQMSIYLGNRKPVDEMNAKELKAHTATLDPEVQARWARKRARQEAASQLAGRR